MWRPLLLFTALGALLFAGDRAFLAKPPRPEPVRISADRLEALRSEAGGIGGEAGEAALASLVQSEVDDELLYRKARELHFDKDDPVVLQRLVQNLRFAGADPARDDASLYQEALELGLDRSDPLVRRRLVQRMRLAIEAEALSPQPADDELRAWYAAHPQRYDQPARTRFVQLYFAREHAGAARARLAELRAHAAAPDAPEARGEPFLHPPEQPPLSDSELALRFGADFATELAKLAPGAWQGPIASAYGLHLVYVQERSGEGLASFESVRDSVRLAFLAERRATTLAAQLAKLREGVEVKIEQAGRSPARSEP